MVLKEEMHQKGAKYSCFHLELIFIQDVLVMAYTWCEIWRGCCDFKNFALTCFAGRTQIQICEVLL